MLPGSDPQPPPQTARAGAGSGSAPCCVAEKDLGYQTTRAGPYPLDCTVLTQSRSGFTEWVISLQYRLTGLVLSSPDHGRCRLKRTADCEGAPVLTRGCAALSACRIGLRRGAALRFGTDAANDSFRDRVRVRGSDHREIHLEHGAECVVVALQRREQVRRRLSHVDLAGLELPDGID